MKNKYKEEIANKKNKARELMNSDQFIKCNAVIHTASIASGASGVIPIPVMDSVPITACQITMVLSLGEIFDRKISESAAKGIITSIAATHVGRSLVKLIPVAGWIASAGVAAALTEVVGWTVAIDMATGALKSWEYQSSDSENNEHEKGSGQSTDEIFTSVEEAYSMAESFINGERNKPDNRAEYEGLIKYCEKHIEEGDKKLEYYYNELMRLR